MVPARALDALRSALESRLPPLLARHLALVDMLAADTMSNGAAGQVSKGLVWLTPATDGKCQSPAAGDVHHPSSVAYSIGAPMQVQQPSPVLAWLAVVLFIASR